MSSSVENTPASWLHLLYVSINLNLYSNIIIKKQTIQFTSNYIQYKQAWYWYWGDGDRPSRPEMATPLYKLKLHTNKSYKHKTNRHQKQSKKRTETCPKFTKVNQVLYVVIRLDLNSFLKCLVVLQCLNLISNEFHKDGPVTRIDRSENIFVALWIL